MAKIIGLVRFSVLAKPDDSSGDARAANPFAHARGMSFEDYAAHILDEKRLATRFRFFEAFCLPSLDAQTDHGFSIIVVAPRLLPDHWRSRLSDLAASRPFMQVKFADETNYSNRMLRHWVKRQMSWWDRLVVTFRIDDDDALSRDFVQRLRAYAKPQFVDHAISLSSGYFVEIDLNGKAFTLRAVDRRNISVGMAYVSSTRHLRTIMDLGNHTRVHEKRPVITDSTKPAFILTTHGGNDSDRRLGRAHDMSADDVISRLESVFTLNLAALAPPPPGQAATL